MPNSIRLPKSAPASKRLPAYGRELLDMRMRGLVPATQVVVGLDTWDYGKRYARCIIPHDQDPAELNYAFLAGLDVVMICQPSKTSEARRDAALKALLAFDPASLRCIEMFDPVNWIWVKSRKHGLEIPEFAE